jgi:hypothetical protein
MGFLFYVAFFLYIALITAITSSLILGFHIGQVVLVKEMRLTSHNPAILAKTAQYSTSTLISSWLVLVFTAISSVIMLGAFFLAFDCQAWNLGLFAVTWAIVIIGQLARWLVSLGSQASPIDSLLDQPKP